MLAETQMRRLNSIVSTLIDSNQRRAYDEQLNAAHSPLRNSSGEGRLSWRGIPWWLASAVGAIVLTLGAVWLWADHLGSSFGGKSTHTLYIPPADTPTTAAAPASDPPHQSPDASTTSVVVTDPTPARPAPKAQAAKATRAASTRTGVLDAAWRARCSSRTERYRKRSTDTRSASFCNAAGPR